MSHDLLTQLAEYGTYCDERQGSVTADDVIDVIVPLPMPTPPTAPRRGWLVALAAAAVILIVIGGVTWLASFSDSVPPAGEPVATTIPQTTVPETTVPATPDTTVPEPTATAPPRAAESVTWTRHEGRVPSGGAYSYDETPVGLVATRTEDFQVPLVYLSSNGFDWTEVPIPAGSNGALAEAFDAFDVEPSPAGIWLTRAGVGLWFADLDSWSSGDPSWEEVFSEADLLDLKGPAPFGSRWAPGISGKARIGNTSLIAIDWELTIDYESILDLPPGYTDIAHDDLDSCYSGGGSGQLSVRGRGSDGEEVCLARVKIINQADGVSVLGEAGNQVAFIENAVADFSYGSGGAHIFVPSEMLDLYASIDGRLELVPSLGTATHQGCGQGLDQGDSTVVHRMDCPYLPELNSTPGLDVARSTTDGVTWVPAADDAGGSFLAGRHPLGFSWESTWPWGPPDDQLGSAAILVSEDGETWTELVRHNGPVLDTPGGIVAMSADENGLADEIVVYNGELLSTVRANWPVGEWPGFLGAIGNTLIVIDGADVWVGELFEG
jgi:hypothetical protein